MCGAPDAASLFATRARDNNFMNGSLTSSKKLRALFSSAVLFATALPACASSSSSTSSGTTAAYFESTCNYLSRCAVDYSAQLGASTVAEGFVLDGMSSIYLDLCGDSGRAAVAAKLAYELALPDAATVDVASMAATIDATACGATPNVTLRPGARAAAASCESDLQCATSACSGTNGSCGKCVARAAVGAACDSQNESAAPCVEGAECGPNDVCVARAAAKKAGDACTTSTDCGSGGILTCAGGVCASSVASVGESCAQKMCLGSACDPVTKVCAAFKTSGACTTSYQCDIFHGYACADATKTCTRFTGTAVRAKSGEACGPQSSGFSIECAPGLACDSASNKCVDARTTCSAT
jgi:hypothetical protein